jgi:hypothetical protein
MGSTKLGPAMTLFARVSVLCMALLAAWEVWACAVLLYGPFVVSDGVTASGALRIFVALAVGLGALQQTVVLTHTALRGLDAARRDFAEKAMHPVGTMALLLGAAVVLLRWLVSYGTVVTNQRRVPFFTYEVGNPSVRMWGILAVTTVIVTFVLTFVSWTLTESLGTAFMRLRLRRSVSQGVRRAERGHRRIHDDIQAESQRFLEQRRRGK